VSDAVQRSGLRLAGLLAVAFVLANLHPRGRPATICMLRAVTGVPCPLCGGTTAAVHVGRADLRGAVQASPLVVIAAPVIAALPLLRGRLARLPAYVRVFGPLIALAGSELWQLHRFGWL
jgi:hypothetical protein